MEGWLQLEEELEGGAKEEGRRGLRLIAGWAPPGAIEGNVLPLGAQTRADLVDPLQAGGAFEGYTPPRDVAVADATGVGGTGIRTLPRQEQEEGYEGG